MNEEKGRRERVLEMLIYEDIDFLFVFSYLYDNRIFLQGSKMNSGEYITAQVTIKLRKNDKKKLLKLSPGNVVHIVTLKHETYPYETKSIHSGRNIYELAKKIQCLVEFKEDNYIISNNELDLTAWGKSRDEAIEAFAFCFSALYEMSSKTQDAKMTKKALAVKKKLMQLVEGVKNASKKK